MTKASPNPPRKWTKKQYALVLWANDWGLTALLVILFASMFVMYPLANVSSSKILTRVVYSLIFISGVMTVFENRHLRTFAVVVAVLSMGVGWANLFSPGLKLVHWDLCLGLIFLALLIATILTQVFRAGPINAHRICGAVAVYLLAAYGWSLLYQLLALFVPEAFRFQESLSANDPEANRAILTYFSFITLTTLGYGDIVPIHPMARMLVILEALTGQLFPAILLARLVSLEILHRDPGKRAQRD